MPITYVKPIACKTAQYILAISPQPQTGDLQIFFDNSAGNYIIGTPIYVSEAGGSSINYCGEAIAAAPTYVQVRFPIKRNYTNAFIFSPTDYFIPTYERVQATQIDREGGPIVKVTEAGVLYPTKVTDRFNVVELTFSQGAGSDFKLFREFVDTDLNGGLTKCTLTWYDLIEGTNYIGASHTASGYFDVNSQSTVEVDRFFVSYSMRFMYDIDDDGVFT